MISSVQFSLARLLLCVFCAALAMGFFGYFGRSMNLLVWLPSLVVAGAATGASVGSLLGATEKGAVLGAFFAIPAFWFLVLVRL